MFYNFTSFLFQEATKCNRYQSHNKKLTKTEWLKIKKKCTSMITVAIYEEDAPKKKQTNRLH